MTWQKFGALCTSFLRSALAAGIALVLSERMNLLKMSNDEWMLVANAAIAAGLVTIYVFLDPNDSRFGVGSAPTTTELTEIEGTDA